MGYKRMRGIWSMQGPLAAVGLCGHRCRATSCTMVVAVCRQVVVVVEMSSLSSIFGDWLAIVSVGEEETGTYGIWEGKLLISNQHSFQQRTTNTIDSHEHHRHGRRQRCNYQYRPPPQPVAPVLTTSPSYSYLIVVQHVSCSDFIPPPKLIGFTA